MRVDRRQFLSVTATGALAVLTGAAARADTDGARLDGARALARPDLLTTLGADAVRAIGRRYREAVPAEDGVAALQAALQAALPAGSGVRLSAEALARDDFRAGRVVVVDRWMLSATEARQCALFSLLHA